jgi:hypothetical protein
MTRIALPGLAAGAVLVIASTQWSGVAVAARNTKPQEIVVVGSKIPSAGAARRKGAPKRLRTRPSNPKGGLLKQQGRPIIESDANQ